jgi:hypothetical protein
MATPGCRSPVVGSMTASTGIGSAIVPLKCNELWPGPSEAPRSKLRGILADASVLEAATPKPPLAIRVIGRPLLVSAIAYSKNGARSMLTSPANCSMYSANSDSFGMEKTKMYPARTPPSPPFRPWTTISYSSPL